MDPQEVMNQIIRIVRRSNDQPQTQEDRDRDWSDVGEAFESLAGWLKAGGFPPTATGPIFGMGRMNVGYPGMDRNSPDRFVPTPIKHVKNQPSNWRYAILTKDADDLHAWVFVEYDHRGTERNRWEFPTQ